ncbi:Tctex1 domain-containing protein 2, partial [Globisporangium splendens]
MPAPPAKAEGAAALRLNPKNKYVRLAVAQVSMGSGGSSEVLQEKLDKATYQSDRASVLTKEIADAVKAKLKDCNYARCKYVVQVVIGEQRGEGVRTHAKTFVSYNGCRMGCRCFWDAETDCYASETFSNVRS